jgi:hypothetical protein
VNESRSRNRAGWRPFVSCVAAYGLVLQVFFGGIVGARLTADAVASNDATGHVLCLSGSDGSSFPEPTQPTYPRSGKTHCLLCATGVHSHALITAAPTSSIVYTDGETLSWLLHHNDRLSSAKYLNQRSRAPPLEV